MGPGIADKACVVSWYWGVHIFRKPRMKTSVYASSPVLCPRPRTPCITTSPMNISTMVSIITMIIINAIMILMSILISTVILSTTVEFVEMVRNIRLFTAQARVAFSRSNKIKNLGSHPLTVHNRGHIQGPIFFITVPTQLLMSGGSNHLRIVMRRTSLAI